MQTESGQAGESGGAAVDQLVEGVQALALQGGDSAATTSSSDSSGSSDSSSTPSSGAAAAVATCAAAVEANGSGSAAASGTPEYSRLGKGQPEVVKKQLFGEVVGREGDGVVSDVATGRGEGDLVTGLAEEDGVVSEGRGASAASMTRTWSGFPTLQAKSGEVLGPGETAASAAAAAAAAAVAAAGGGSGVRSCIPATPDLKLLIERGGAAPSGGVGPAGLGLRHPPESPNAAPSPGSNFVSPGARTFAPPFGAKFGDRTAATGASTGLATGLGGSAGHVGENKVKGAGAVSRPKGLPRTASGLSKKGGVQEQDVEADEGDEEGLGVDGGEEGGGEAVGGEDGVASGSGLGSPVFVPVPPPVEIVAATNFVSNTAAPAAAVAVAGPTPARLLSPTPSSPSRGAAPAVIVARPGAAAAAVASASSAVVSPNRGSSSTAGNGPGVSGASSSSSAGGARPRLRLAFEGNRMEVAVPAASSKFAPTPRPESKSKSSVLTTGAAPGWRGASPALGDIGDED